MADEPKVTRHAWCHQAAAALRSAAGSEADLDLVRAEVQQDRCTELYRVTGSAEGWLVLRLEGNVLGERELVIVLGAGRGIRPVIPIIQRYAAALGAGLRTHITRPGLERIYQHQGFHLAEKVYKWRPGDGQQVKKQHQ